MSKACVDCGEAISGLQRSGRCHACLAWYCEHCGERMDRPRAGRLCTECSREKRRRYAQKPRSCYVCRAMLPAGRLSQLCTNCTRETYLLRRAVLLRQGVRLCRECGEVMPVGRDNALCTDCYQKKRQKGWLQRPCGMCRQRLRSRASSYCKPCHSLYQNWLRSYREGSPDAKLVKPKANRRRWQEKSS